MYQKISVNKWRLPNTVIRLYNSIISDESYLSGRPTIEGTGISPFVIGMFHDGGDSIDVLCNLYDLPKHKIEDAEAQTFHHNEKQKSILRELGLEHLIK